ncbi:MAG: hypothetical protein OEY01_03755 [Desulfobulbaceae bacterium]|nr:hypothetical protein [Desulfobulbaceae bacterium]
MTEKETHDYTEDVEEILNAHPSQVTGYLGGHRALLGFFTGHAMHALVPKYGLRELNMDLLQETLTQALESRREEVEII